MHRRPEIAAEDGHTIGLAKAWLIREYDGPRPDLERPWGEGIAVPGSYKDPRYRVRLIVRLGSPPKGYIVADCHGVTAVAHESRRKRFLGDHDCEQDYRNEHAWARSMGLFPTGDGGEDPR